MSESMKLAQHRSERFNMMWKAWFSFRVVDWLDLNGSWTSDEKLDRFTKTGVGNSLGMVEQHAM